MREMPFISFVVLSYQSGVYLEPCLKSIFSQSPDLEVILADNGSTDLGPHRAMDRFKDLIFIDHGENLGFAKGMNRAAKQAKGEWLGFINPDVVMHKDWLLHMKLAAKTYPEVSIFTSLQLNPENLEIMDGAGDGYSFFGFPFRMGYGQKKSTNLSVSAVFSPCGAAFMIRRELFEAMSGFYEPFFIYCEDADLGFRAQLRQEPVLLIPEAKVDHIGSATLGARSDFALSYGYRNRLWMYLKNTPWPVLVLTLWPHVIMTLIMAINDSLAGRGHVVWPTLKEALKGLKFIWFERKAVQETRLLGSFEFMTKMTWNPRTLLRRGLDLRKIK
jgi:N-acetylglucosaminyl-diphospho-decaprenol L-rhamnosyltransferase